MQIIIMVSLMWKIQCTCWVMCSATTADCVITMHMRAEATIVPLQCYTCGFPNYCLLLSLSDCLYIMEIQNVVYYTTYYFWWKHLVYFAPSSQSFNTSLCSTLQSDNTWFTKRHYKLWCTGKYRLETDVLSLHIILFACMNPIGFTDTIQGIWKPHYIIQHFLFWLGHW